MVEDLYYKAAHYNLKYKTGALLNRITAHDICGIRPADIEWIWIVEQDRYATLEENQGALQASPETLNDAVDCRVWVTKDVPKCSTFPHYFALRGLTDAFSRVGLHTVFRRS